MDVLLELLVQVFVVLFDALFGDVLVEGAAHGIGHLWRRRAGRFVLAGLVGLGIGLAWGAHLSGAATYPRLTWVSLVLAAAALLLAAGRAGAPPEPAPAGRPAWWAVLVPPWLWSAERLVGSAVLNAAVAAGIALSRHG